MERSKELTRPAHWWRVLFWLSMVWIPFNLPAVLFLNTDDTTHNTTRPEDPAAAKAWDLQGIWKCCLGTPIAPHWFLSAKHIGGSIGESFELQGQTYTVIARELDPDSDLVLWGVSEPFPEVAAIYPRQDEVGARLLVFGRGAARGEPVRVEQLGTSLLKGWTPGTRQFLKRWGENVVSEIEDDPDVIAQGLGHLLGSTFDRDGPPDEAGLSAGDSGGGMFLRDGDSWKLAAISYAAGGQYNTSNQGTGFTAMLFDEGGLFRLRDPNAAEPWERIPDLPEDQPSSIWGTRLQFRLNWILETTQNMPDPIDSITLEMAADPRGPFFEVTHWSLVEQPLALRIPRPVGTAFFRIQASTPLQIGKLSITEEDLLLPFSGR